jgi:hypothetical protein
MQNLKPYLDAAVAADNEVKQILAEMDAAFTEGTEEGKKKALELRPALDEAKVKAEQANALYVSMRDASLVSDNVAALFTSPADPAQEPDQAEAKVMTRAAYRQLSPHDRLAFSKGGGKLTD